MNYLKKKFNQELLEQKQEDSTTDLFIDPKKKLTKVELSDKQLVSTSRGGRKLRRTINRWIKTRINRRKSKKQRKIEHKTRKCFRFSNKIKI